MSSAGAGYFYCFDPGWLYINCLTTIAAPAADAYFAPVGGTRGPYGVPDRQSLIGYRGFGLQKLPAFGGVGFSPSLKGDADFPAAGQVGGDPGIEHQPLTIRK